MHRLDFKRGTVERIDPETPPKGGGEFGAIPSTADGPRVIREDELHELIRREALVGIRQARAALLAEIDAWLLNEALYDDADGAKRDADFYRVVRVRLAEEFKP